MARTFSLTELLKDINRVSKEVEGESKFSFLTQKSKFLWCYFHLDLFSLLVGQEIKSRILVSL